MHIAEFELNDLSLLNTIQPEDWNDIRPAYEFYFVSASCRPIKMVEGGELIGVGSAIYHKDTAWIGHIIVHPNHRGRGIGTLLAQFLVDCLKAQKFKSISLVSTPIGVSMYQKLGFQIQWEYIFYEYPQKFIPPIKSDCVTPYHPKYLEQIFRLDRLVSSEDRRAVIGFHLQKSMIFQMHDTLQGVYFPTLGEGLILALNDEAGIELAKYRLLEKPKSVVPESNSSVIRVLESMEMSIYRTGTRMFIGEPVELNPRMLYSRIGGNMG